MASADRIQLSYVDEVTLGVTPTSPAMQIMRASSESLNYNITNVTSTQLTEDRSQSDLIQVGADVSGDISGELSFSTFDAFFESAFADVFVVQPDATIKILRNGTTMQSMTVLKRFMDLASVQHRLQGLTVESMTMGIKKRAIISLAFSMMGTTFADTTPSGATFVAASTSEPLNSSSNVTSIMFDSVPMTSCVDSMSVVVKNNLRPRDCVGSLTHTNFTFGRCEVTGDMEIYFQDTTLYNKYKDGLAFSLDFTIQDAAGNAYEFNLPRVKFEKLTTVAGGTNQDIMAKGSFRALKSAPLAAPVQSAAATSGTGGTLAAATYYYVVCSLNPSESLKSNERSITTTGSTSSNTITWTAVPGASGYRIFRGTAAGTETLYYTVGAVTTFLDIGGAGTSGIPPTQVGHMIELTANAA